MAITIELPAQYVEALAERAAVAGSSPAEFAAEAAVVGVAARDRVGSYLQSKGAWPDDPLAEEEFNELTWRLVHGARGDPRAFAFDEKPGTPIVIDIPPVVFALLVQQAAGEDRPVADLAAASVVIAVTTVANRPAWAGA